MITYVLGFPRAGKTTYSALLAMQAQKKGIPVYSSMPLRDCYELNPESDLGVYHIEDAVILLDEAGAEFDSRDSKNFKKQYKMLFTMHGHYGLDVTVLSQRIDVDKNIRDLCEIMYIVQPSRIKNFIKLRPIYRHWVVVDDGPKVIHREIHWIFHKRLYAPKSYSMFDSWHREQLKQKEWKKWEFEDIPDKNSDTFQPIYDYIKEKIFIYILTFKTFLKNNRG